MHKSASDRQSFITRTGSHATKPSAGGVVRDLPPDAAEPEEYYRSLREQFTALLQELEGQRTRLVEVKERLRATLPFKEFEMLEKERDRLGQVLQELQEDCIELRRIARSAALEAWNATWVAVATQLLPTDTLKKINDDTKGWLGRPQQEIAKPSADKSDAFKDALNRKERRKRVRKRLADRQNLVSWERKAKGSYGPRRESFKDS